MGWIKYFEDGSLLKEEEVGSWLKSKLTEIKKVKITQGNKTISLSVQNTKWHQSDRFVTSFSYGIQKPSLERREIHAFISDKHKNCFLNIFKNKDLIELKIEKEGEKKIPLEWINKWIILSIDRYDQVKVRIKKK